VNIEVEVLTLIKDAYEANPAAILATIQSAEGGIEGFVAKGLSEFKPGGALGLVYSAVEPAVDSAINNLITTQGAPSVVYSLIDALLAKAIASATPAVAAKT
jgi:hypothetical protein